MLKRLVAARRSLLAAAVCLSVFPSISGLGANAALSARTTPDTFSPPAAISNIRQAEAAAYAQYVLPQDTVATSRPAAPASTTSSTLSSPAKPDPVPADRAVAKVAPKAAPVSKTASAAVFSSYISRVDSTFKQQMLEAGIWKASAPIPLDQLRVLEVSYWDFAGEVQKGRLIVNQAWSVQLSKVFRTLFEAKFPLRHMDPLQGAVTRGSADAVDNTRAFQARRVNGGWSMHAYGLAVDINPAENPWVRSGSIIPTAGASFLDRTSDAPGLVKADSVVVKAFKAVGWKWGGNWSSSKDYMHFSSNGR